MARGFESKDVEYQQAESQTPRTAARTLTPLERDEAARRGALDLALARARSDLAAATVPAHRRMLEQAIADLLRQLATHV